MSESNDAPKVVSLTISERMNFSSILPAQADFLTISLKQDILKKVTLTPEEGEKIEMTVESAEGKTSVNWNVEKEFEIKFEVTKLENELICKELSDKDARRILTDAMHSIYKKFIKLD